MVGTDYARLRQRLADMITGDPTTVQFHGRDDSLIEAVGRLAPSGSRTFGRMGQSFQLPGTEVVGSQLHILELPYDTAQPIVGAEARTVRQGVTQRFTVAAVIPSPWKLEVVIDETR